MAAYESIEECPPLPEVSGIEVRHVPGCVGYAAGSDGSIWSCQRLGRSRIQARWRERRIAINNDGYRQLGLSVNGKKRAYSASRLVCCAFHGLPPQGMEVCHFDGVPLNDRPQNLRWGTRKDNADDAVRHGTSISLKPQRGEDHPLSRLTVADVQMIRHLTQWCSQREIAILYGVHKAHVQHIATGLVWSWL